MDQTPATVKASETHAQRAIRWLRVQHGLLAYYRDGKLCAAPGNNRSETLALLNAALQATRQ